jgi:hypothetical protein
MIDLETRQPFDALIFYTDFSILNRKRLPVFIFDNLEYVSNVDRLISWTVAIYLNSFSLITLALQDSTLYRLRKQTSDQLEKHNVESFWLYKPKIRKVLEKRCDYLRSLIESQKGSNNRFTAAVGAKRQFQWTVEPDQIIKAITGILLTDEEISNWLGQLCNYNIQEVLTLCRQILLSPHFQEKDLFKSQATGVVHRAKVMRAIIAPDSHVFQGRPTDKVISIFGTWVADEWAPLLPLRVLSYLRHVEDSERNRKQSFPGFVLVRQVCDFFDRNYSVGERHVMNALNRMFASNLIEPFAPDVRSLDDRINSEKIKIQPKGRLLLDWAFKEKIYVRMMGAVDLVEESEALYSLRDAYRTLIDFIRSGNVQQIFAAESAFVTQYISHLLASASGLSGTPENGETRAIREAEHSLSGWCKGSTEESTPLHNA